ncbi:MAG TPA: DUF456 domain-containing protein [Pseudonocardia sp.]|uniref:DUF456 domain-containing protein n=1 Tax=Pseudonocardia sp. TaxID=60912 RepID=UPI002BD4504D|nr:DUF456 domain-containing protein [Pseudonocardia sp.]HTF54098.1 DUF456 domain-containing protein [Pseudonocardia sp.]
MTVYAVVAGVLVAVGLIGTVLTVLPGLVLVVAGIAVWAVPRNDVVGWTVLAAAVGVALLGSVAKYLLPGRALKAAGVPGRSLVAGVVLGIIGFFVIPVIGLFFGFVLGVYLAELLRLREHAQAWPSTTQALRAVGWSILIELAAGLLATAVWIIGMIVG